MTDVVGHGTFVTGLIAAVDGNGIGTKGVAGNTQILAIRASANGSFDRARPAARHRLRAAPRRRRAQPEPGRRRPLPQRGARARHRLLQRRAAGGRLRQPGARTATRSSSRPPCSAAGAATRASASRWRATRPGRQRAAPSPPTTTTSASRRPARAAATASSASSPPCRATARDWDDPRLVLAPCSRQGGARYAYGEGTSFAAPIASGIAALVWQVERRLASEQVADVLIRSARQTQGTGWNEFTGAGVVDGGAATALARTYDVTAPRARGSARRGGRPRPRARAPVARPHRARPRAAPAACATALLVSRDGGRTYARAASAGAGARSTAAVRLRGSARTCSWPLACDANGNCGRQAAGPRAAALEVAHRVHRRPVHARLEVQVVAEAVAGAAHVADHLALATAAPFEVAKLDWWA